MSEQRVGYRFGPLERHGLLGPIRVGQGLTVGGGLLLAVLMLDLLPSVAGALLAVLALALALACSTVPWGGRTLEEWSPVTAGFALRVINGRRRFRSSLPTVGRRARIPGAVSAATAHEIAASLPPSLRGVQMVAVDSGKRSLGALSELRGRRLTAVLACRALSFALLDAEAQERRLAQWGLVLTGAASGPIRRLQWIERTAPAQGDELARWLHDARDPALPPRGVPIVESYLELIGTSTRVAHDHEVLLAVQVDRERVHGHHGLDLAEILVEETTRLARGLEAAQIKVLGALDVNQLGRALRTAFDPYALAELGVLEATGPRRRGSSLSAGAALASEEHWDRYRCDGAWHASFWISAWPRVEVSPMFMDALLGSSDTVRTVAVTFEPVAPARSRREVEAAITRDRADSELRRRFGQSETARQRQAQESAMRREAELAAGHGEVRLAGFVTVSGRDQDELRRACAQIHQQAAQARLELRRLYGQQAEAFTFTLPLARGLR